MPDPGELGQREVDGHNADLRPFDLVGDVDVLVVARVEEDGRAVKGKNPWCDHLSGYGRGIE